MTKAAAKSAAKEIEALREKIRHHEHQYYVLDDPEISDAIDKSSSAKHPSYVLGRLV